MDRKVKSISVLNLVRHVGEIQFLLEKNIKIGKGEKVHIEIALQGIKCLWNVKDVR